MSSIELSSQLSDLYANAKIALKSTSEPNVSLAKRIVKEMQKRIVVAKSSIKDSYSNFLHQ